MSWFVYLGAAAVAIVWWRRRHAIKDGWRRHNVPASVRWLAALALLRRCRPADVQFAIVRQILASRTVGVTGTARVPGSVEVHVGDADWEALAGALQWTADEVAAAIRHRCEQRGWEITEPIDVVIAHSPESRRLLPEVFVTTPRTQEAAERGDASALAGRRADPLSPTDPMPSAASPRRGRPPSVLRLANGATTTVADPLPPTQPLPGLLLIPEDSAMPAIMAPGDVDELTVGRSRDADAWVDTPTISRVHCLLLRRNGQWFIDDLCSTNGTFVNGEPVRSPRRLVDGDSVGLGSNITFRVR